MRNRNVTKVLRGKESLITQEKKRKKKEGGRERGEREMEECPKCYVQRKLIPLADTTAKQKKK
jgi:hypothetical protein